jgi:carboxyl-terminal processing protease
MKRRSTRGSLRLEGGLLLTGILLLAICTYLLATVDQRVRATTKTEKSDNQELNDEYLRFSELMADTFAQIQERYVDEVPPEKLFNAALQGMFDALDPHSAYLNSDNFKDLEKTTEGEFSGIGIHIDIRDGVLTVVSPIPGTPGARAGILAWDRIVEIEGKSTEGITSTEAIRQLTGPVGTKVSIVIYRESARKRIPFTIIRDRVKVESVYSNVDKTDYVTPYFMYLLKNKIGYIRLTRFSEGVSQEIEKVLDEMKAQGVEGLILDGRSNTGGLLEEGKRVANLFLDKGQVIVATKGRLKEQNVVYRAESPKKVDWPMVMLVNSGSASATEILAGALKDHHRAVLIGPEGQSTYGKALVQSITPLRISLEKDKDGNYLPNAIRLTTARYYTPNNIGEGGKSIQGVGIEPDLTVKVTTKQMLELYTKGMFLGEPPLLEPGKKVPELLSYDEEEDEVQGLDSEAPAPENGPGGDMQERKPDGKQEMKSDEKKEPGEKSKDVPAIQSPSEDETTPGAGSDDKEKPFYLKKKKKKNEPTTPDTQLKYGADVLRSLLIVGHAKA